MKIRGLLIKENVLLVNIISHDVRYIDERGKKGVVGLGHNGVSPTVTWFR